MQKPTRSTKQASNDDDAAPHWQLPLLLLRERPILDHRGDEHHGTSRRLLILFVSAEGAAVGRRSISNDTAYQVAGLGR